jgi:hypothetical protein
MKKLIFIIAALILSAPVYASQELPGWGTKKDIEWQNYFIKVITIAEQNIAKQPVKDLQKGMIVDQCYRGGPSKGNKCRVVVGYETESGEGFYAVFYYDKSNKKVAREYQKLLRLKCFTRIGEDDEMTCINHDTGETQVMNGLSGLGI